MRLIKSNDLFELRVLSQVSNEDLRVLNLLYQPFLGNLAVSIYQTLLLTRVLYEDGPSSHEFLFNQLGTTSLDFANAIVRLEACELLRSYAQKTDDFTLFYYELFSPKGAKGFFADPVFSGLLTSYVGERRVQQLTGLFSSDKKYDLKENEITTSFSEVYTPDFNSSSFNKGVDNAHLGKNELKRKSPFNPELFKEYLRKNHMIIADLGLNQEDMRKIINLTVIYSFNEETMAAQIGASYDGSKPLGERIDYDYVNRNLKELSRYKHIAKPKRIKPTNLLSSDSEKAKLINRMELESCLDFLSSFNEGSVVANSEINLLLRLSNEYNLSNGVINALVYQVLMTKNMQLQPAYVESIASNLSRLKFSHAIDVINYFDEQQNGRKVKPQTIKQPSTMKKTDEEEMSDEDYKRLLEELKNVS